MNCRRLITFVTILSLATLLLASHPVLAQSTGSAQYPNIPPNTISEDFASLLQPDGTLQIPAGMEGSFKLDGWRMSLDASGQPHFTSAQDQIAATSPDDRFWSHDFLLGAENIGNGGAGTVFAMAADNNWVYIGGDFTAVGSIQAQHIARWDITNRRWEALGSGVNSRVSAIAIYNNYVYVGGSFNYAGEISTGPLARWDTSSTTWSSIGVIDQVTIAPTVYALSVAANGDLYIGGSFNKVGALEVNNIARLTTSGWDNLNGGVTGASVVTTSVFALGLSNLGKLYVGGSFNKAGGYNASNLAVLDNGSWHPVGGGVGGSNAAVYALSVTAETQVFVGGNFSQAYNGVGGTATVHNVAAWSGVSSSWSDMSGGVDADAEVRALILVDTSVYVAGRFTHAGGNPHRYVARWDGAWQTVGDPDETNDGTDGNVEALAANDYYLFLGGSFEQAGDRAAHHVAGFYISQSRWTGLGSSVNGSVTALAISDDGYVYIGGKFSDANGMRKAYLVRWYIANNRWYFAGDGNEFSGCTGYLCSPEVDALLLDGHDLYVGGNFTKIGSSLTVHGIAKFHDTNLGGYGWTALGNGVTCSTFLCQSIVRDIAMVGSTLYVGGSFTAAGGTAANNVAAWSGSAWSALQDFSNNGTNGAVYALSPMTNGVAVGGSFSTPSNYLAKWTGANWTTIGVNSNTLNGAVYTIIGGTASTIMYIGGAFSLPAARLAWLNSSTWQSLPGTGNALNGPVRALAYDGKGGIYAGGDFTMSGPNPLLYIGNYNGGVWRSLGSGMDASVYALAGEGTLLMAAGDFKLAGNYPSYFIAEWNTSIVFLPLIRK